MKRCRHCQRDLSLESYYRDSQMRDGRASWCRRCSDAQSRESATSEAGRARLRLYWRAYYAARRLPKPEVACAACGEPFTARNRVQKYCTVDCRQAARNKSRGRPRALGPKIRRAIIKRDGWHCYLCDRPIDPALKWPHAGYGTIDHVVPVARGGDLYRHNNLRMAHWQCNFDKGDTDAPWWVLTRLAVL